MQTIHDASLAPQRSIKPLTTLIVDDEDLAREKIRYFLADDAAFQIAGECENGFQAVEATLEHLPDVVLLDVQMPEMNGFEALRLIRSSLDEGEQMPFVVFITAYDHYALQAFNEHAVDYLLKPFDYERFQAMLARVKENAVNAQARALNKQLLELLEHRDAQNAQTPRYAERFVFKTRGRVYFVNADDVEWIEADRNYALFHVEQATHILRETFAELEQRLNPAHFLRVHRSAIVHRGRIAEVRKRSDRDYELVLVNGHVLDVGPNYREAVLSALHSNS